MHVAIPIHVVCSFLPYTYLLKKVSGAFQPIVEVILQSLVGTVTVSRHFFSQGNGDFAILISFIFFWPPFVPPSEVRFLLFLFVAAALELRLLLFVAAALELLGQSTRWPPLMARKIVVEEKETTRKVTETKVRGTSKRPWAEVSPFLTT